MVSYKFKVKNFKKIVFISKIISKTNKKLISKLRIYFKDPWNIIDVMGILFFILGMLLRFLFKNSEIVYFRAARLLNNYVYMHSYCFYHIKFFLRNFFILCFAIFFVELFK
jgi:hypothetical protein